jgi:predicted TIM-barrel fold metal-dependent hydrolase
MIPKSYQYGALLLALLVAGCGRAPGPEGTPPADAGLLSEIQQIRAIDNHAHPVRFTAQGEPSDRFYDALPVDNLEPGSDPLIYRPGAVTPVPGKRAAMSQRGVEYPSWVLDQMGIEIMLANRVEMGPGIQPPRFRWVPYADALLFPLDNSALAARNSDRKAFFALEDELRGRYQRDAAVKVIPGTLDSYLARIVTPTLERHRQGGAVAEKFEAAYLRSLAFDPVDRATAARIYERFGLLQPTPSEAEYKLLQDFLFRYIAAECGRLGMAVHLHAEAGAGSYFDVAGANPLLLESVLNDPSLRKTKFVMIHGGWPFTREIMPLLTKPNAWLDFSSQDLQFTPATLAVTLREWLEWVPEKILFATDAYPYSDQLGWEESGVIASHNAREALARALTAMMRDGEITRARAGELARMVLRDNARKLYGW